MKWQTDKPNEPCIFVARGTNYNNEIIDYSLHILKLEPNPVAEGMCLNCYNGNDDEDDFPEYNVKDYLIIQKL